MATWRPFASRHCKLRAEGMTPRATIRSPPLNITLLTKAVAAPSVPRRLRSAATTGLASIASLSITGAAFAQSPVGAGGAGSIGAQLDSMSAEAINSGGTFAGAVMYLLALIVFIGAVWALWKSRQPQGRETGYVGMGIAGLVLCGLFVTGGTWINKAAVSTSGSAATINSAPKVVTFQ